jgi:diguanylate cyclase (GGDEF)-like protein
VSRAQRYDERAALLIVDVDAFKSINDAHGHAIGDEALRVIAAALRQRLRDSDALARIGGDEFAVLALDTSEGDASELADRVRRSILAHGEVDGVRLSASIGFASAPPAAGLPEALAAADAAMYARKSRTRHLATAS